MLLARAWARTLLLSLAWGACGHAAIPAAQVSTFHAVQDYRSAADPLSRAMQSLAARVERTGMHAEREAFSGFLVAGARATRAFDVPARMCLTLVAIASAGIQDIDASIYNPQGDVIAVDSQPDAHPTLQVCAGNEAQRLYYTLQIYEGAGTFLMTTFVGPKSRLEAAAAEIGVRPLVADLSETGGTDGPGRVNAFRDGIQRRGFALVQSPMRVPLLGEQRIRAAIRVAEGGCYTAAGFAFEGLRNLALRVLDEEGVEVARDRSGSDDASVQFCADRAAEYAAELEGGAGKGSALLLLFRADAAQIGGRAGLWLGERPLARPSLRPLPDALRMVSDEAASDGFRRSRTLQTGHLQPGAAITHRFKLDAGRCARVEAVGGPGIRALELIAVDASGRHLAEGAGDATTTYVHVCSRGGRELTLELFAAAGSGPYALTAHEAVLSEIAPRGEDETLAAGLQQALREARDRGYRPLPAFRDPQRIVVRASEPISIKLAKEPMRCLRAYVLSKGQTRLGLRVAGVEVEAAEPGHAEPVRYCTGKETPASVDALELRLSSEAERDEAWVTVLVR